MKHATLVTRLVCVEGEKQSGAMEKIEKTPSRCVGPAYRPEEQKPKATISTELEHENVQILPQTPQLIALLT